jgi:hypothetical protein
VINIEEKYRSVRNVLSSLVSLLPETRLSNNIKTELKETKFDGEYCTELAEWRVVESVWVP